MIRVYVVIFLLLQQDLFDLVSGMFSILILFINLFTHS